MRGAVVLTTLAAGAALAFWVASSGAQVIGATPCEKACYEQKAECVGACGENVNPIECEGQCGESLDDCLRSCRQ